MIDSYKHHSPSGLNIFAASPAMFVLERVLGKKQPGNVPMHLGNAVEDGVTFGLLNPEAELEDCIVIANTRYEFLTGLSGDARREAYRLDIPPMVKLALTELRPYGIPSHTQGNIRWETDGVKLPFVGRFDYHWEEYNITVDLKTTHAMPSQIKTSHARQVSLYVAGGNATGRLTYVTPKKCLTYPIPDIGGHRAALVELAKRVEAFLSLSDDPAFFTSITAPDIESFYWSGPPARQLAFEHWRI